ncbi:hypothetical protein BU15DRAFT_67573 [Melanogaster broomeanus]|nr:hypothetical protein BU15DRAFT_67573 [Melanogaster broomeanus]
MADFHERIEIGMGRNLKPQSYWTRKRANGWSGIDGPSNVCPRDDCLDSRPTLVSSTIVSVGRALFPLFALALELPETYFSDLTKNSAAIMRTLHYPLQDGHSRTSMTKTPGIGAHTDFECFTILWQQPNVQVLQVMNSEKRWINAPPIKGYSGCQAPSHQHRRSTCHVDKAMNKSGKERYSIPLFFGTDYHVNIEPIPSCVSANRPAKYSPVTAGDYVNKRLKDMYHTV